MKLSDKISSFFFPHRCTFCGKNVHYKDNTYICADCINSLPYLSGTLCARCNKPISDTALSVCYTCRHFNHSFTKSYTPLLYKDKVRKSLISMKFYNKEFYSRSYAFLIAENIISQDFPSFDFITYAPLSPESFSKRKYNQSKDIAQGVGEILNIPVIDTLYRINGTPKQSELSFNERRKNAKASFFSNDIILKGKALLIDDIYTTGATADYCSKLLLKMGCESVSIATVCLKTKD